MSVKMLECIVYDEGYFLCFDILEKIDVYIDGEDLYLLGDSLCCEFQLV